MAARHAPEFWWAVGYDLMCGMGVARAAKKHGTSKRAVEAARERFRETGRMEAAKPTGGAGEVRRAARGTTERQEGKVGKLIDKHRGEKLEYTSRMVKKTLKLSKVGKRTVARRVNEQKFGRANCTIKEPGSEEDTEKRMKAMLEHVRPAATEAAAKAADGVTGDYVIRGGLSQRQICLAQQLRAAMRRGSVDPKSPLCQRMRRVLTSEEHGRYDAMNCKDKANFRIEWAGTELEEFEEEKVKISEWRQIDTEDGQYLSVNAIAQKEGGAPEDYEAALRIVTKCAALGWPWVLYNDASERFDFLYVRKSRSEVFSRSWQLLQCARAAKYGDASAAVTLTDLGTPKTGSLTATPKAKTKASANDTHQKTEAKEGDT